MTFYEVALFVHVFAAIALVGGSIAAHLSLHQLRKVRTIEGARAHASWLRFFSKATMPIAVVVLAAGLYLAFAGDFWGAGWPAVSLGLFALAGVGAGAVVDPAVERMRATLEGEPDGAASDGLIESLVEPKLARVVWVMFGADLAIVMLMTAKPALTAALITAAVGLALGAVLAERDLRHRRGAAPAAPSSPPAAPAV